MHKKHTLQLNKQFIVFYTIEQDKNIKQFGEAGERTLNAMLEIVSAARASTENKISPNLLIEEDQSWTIDSINNNYISKNFQIKSRSRFGTI